MWFNFRKNKKQKRCDCSNCLREGLKKEAVVSMHMENYKIDMCQECLNEYVGILKEDNSRLQQLKQIEVVK